MKRIVITGGGTGGHIYPALAVAKALQADPLQPEILYVGNEGSLESKLVPEAGFAFESIRFAGMPRHKNPLKMAWKLTVWLFWLLRAWVQVRRILKRFQPDVVFGTGGYVSAPVLIAAKDLGIPYMIHEPDAQPGLANRMMGWGAAQVTASFEESRKKLNAKHFTVTGNPVRSEIGLMNRSNAVHQLQASFHLQIQPEQTILLAFGGSQGARKLNESVIEALPDLITHLNLIVIHQTGDKLFEETKASIPEAFQNHPQYLVRPYFDDMATILSAGDIALSRAGSMFLTELHMAGLPAILVPFPYAAANHQLKNAMAMVESGSALLIPDQDCTGPRIVKELTALLNQPDQLRQMEKASKTLAKPQATANIVAILKSQLF